MQTSPDMDQLKINQFYLHNNVCNILGGGVAFISTLKGGEICLKYKISLSFDRLPSVHPLKQPGLLQNHLLPGSPFKHLAASAEPSVWQGSPRLNTCNETRVHPPASAAGPHQRHLVRFLDTRSLCGCLRVAGSVLIAG